jgi:hypothetical protein
MMLLPMPHKAACMDPIPFGYLTFRLAEYGGKARLKLSTEKMLVTAGIGTSELGRRSDLES